MTSRLLVASPGGHLDELYEIVGRDGPGPEDLWVTARTPQSTALLAGRRVHWVPPVRSGEYARALAGVPEAVRVLRRHRPDQLVSTGAALATPFLLTAGLTGARVTYVESATRLAGPSRVGRLAERVPGAALLHQGFSSPRGHWRATASVFSRYQPVARPARVPERVLVILGSEQFGFARGVATARSLVPRGAHVTWQLGYTPAPAGLDGEACPWIPLPDLQAELTRCDLVITHAGVGSILMALQHGLVPVVLPRSRRHGEHVDDHQSQLAERLHDHGVVAVAWPGQPLTWEAALATAQSHQVIRVAHRPGSAETSGRL